ncbi:hypothetical protein JCM10212_001525 [Sporobolomyces blumeae]
MYQLPWKADTRAAKITSPLPHGANRNPRRLLEIPGPLLSAVHRPGRGGRKSGYYATPTVNGGQLAEGAEWIAGPRFSEVFQSNSTGTTYQTTTEARRFRDAGYTFSYAVTINGQMYEVKLRQLRPELYPPTREHAELYNVWFQADFKLPGSESPHDYDIRFYVVPPAHQTGPQYTPISRA